MEDDDHETVRNLQVILAKPNIKRANKSKQSSLFGYSNKQVFVPKVLGVLLAL